MARVEEKVRRMREKEKLPTSISSWWKALIDNNDPPGKRGQTTFYKKIILGLAEGTQTVLSDIDETPWEILRSCLIWFIKCQKVAFDLRDEEFHIGVTLFVCGKLQFRYAWEFGMI